MRVCQPAQFGLQLILLDIYKINKVNPKYSQAEQFRLKFCSGLKWAYIYQSVH